MWAKLTTLFYYPVEIQGLENLPASNQPAVYVSNHQSFLVGAAGAAGGLACRAPPACHLSIPALVTSRAAVS